MRLRYAIVLILLPILFGRVDAAPMDDPDTVYIDGKPCGSFCQSFFSEGVVAAARFKVVGATPRKSYQIERRAASKAPNRRGQRNRAAVAVPEPEMRPVEVRAAVPAELTTNEPQTVLEKPEPLKVEQAVVMAEQFTADAARNISEVAAKSSPGSAGVEVTGSLPLADPRVVLVIAKDEIKSIPELANKSIGVDSSFSDTDATIRIALVAAGAPGIEVSEDPTKAIDRLRRDEVPAAIIGLVLRDAADRFPEINGYRIFRVPLSPS